MPSIRFARPAALFLALLPSVATAGPSPQRRAMLVDGATRHYWLERPATAGPTPLVVILQGALQDPLRFAEGTGLPALARRDGATVVVPETVDGHWNDGRRVFYFGTPSMADDARFLERLLAGLAADGLARADAVLVAGFSNGALMALTLACGTDGVRPAMLALAAATLSAALADSCRAARPLAFVLANGTADPLFPYAGGMGVVNGRRGEPMLSAHATAAHFARVNGCGRERRLAESGESMGRGAGVVVDERVGCPAAGRVVEVGILDGGHEWPAGRAAALGAAAGTASASYAELAWSVFKASLAASGRLPP